MAATVVRADARRRWLSVAAVVAVLCGLPAVIRAIPAGGSPVSAAELRQRILASPQQPYAGYAESSGRLALPDVAELQDVTSLLNGTTRVRAWYAAPDRWRMDVIGAAGRERDTYRTSGGGYIWDYGANLVTRVIGTPPVRLPRGSDLVPPELAVRLLRAAGTDPVSPLPTRRVAGVDAAGLLLVPRDPATTLRRLSIWADQRTGLPLAVQIIGSDGRPALSSQFLSVEQSRPPAATLTPPSGGGGVGVTTTRVPDLTGALRDLDDVTLPAELGGRPRRPLPAGFGGVGGYGTGLAAFAVLALPFGVGDSVLSGVRRAGGADVPLPAGHAGSTGLLPPAIVTVPPPGAGGRPPAAATAVLLRTPLVTMLVVPQSTSGRSYLLAGLVLPAVLEQAAAQFASGGWVVVGGGGR